MSNTKIIKAEIHELHECIQVICYNLGRISMGSKEYDEAEQETKKDMHLLRIAQLEQKLEELK